MKNWSSLIALSNIEPGTAGVGEANRWTCKQYGGPGRAVWVLLDSLLSPIFLRKSSFSVGGFGPRKQFRMVGRTEEGLKD